MSDLLSHVRGDDVFLKSHDDAYLLDLDTGYFWSLADPKRGSGLAPQHIILLQITNFLCFLALVASIIMQFITVNTPAAIFSHPSSGFCLDPIFFPSWILIPVSIGVIATYQTLPSHRDRTVNAHFGIVDRLRLYFAVTIISNIGWIFALDLDEKFLWLATVLIIINWITAMIISIRRLRKNYPGLIRFDEKFSLKNKLTRNILLRFSFDFYLGLVTVRVGSMFAVFFYDQGTYAQSIVSISIQCYCFFQALILYIYYTNIGMSFPVAWALLAIGTHQDGTVSITAYALSSTLILFIGFHLVIHFYRNR